MLKFFLIVLLVQICQAKVAVLPEDENGAKIAQCGGTIDSDSDSLSYPDIDHPMLPGEVCVWTIHLKTTKNFKFNFTSLDVNSNNADCRDGGVRIYSLTNLVPADKLESYTFCDKKPSTDSFFLGENVAVVVLYVGSSNTRPGSGFTLAWEGSAFDPMQTRHVSSFSSASNGIVRYPVIGHYEPNLAATWLIKSVSLQQTTKSDLNLESLSLETCGNPDRCTCDALIVYEISPQGFVNETKRFCGESSGGFLHGVESRFILAFFTDFNAQPNGGGGFQITYYQTEEASTSSEWPTTTEEQSTTELWTTEEQTTEYTTEEWTTEDPPTTTEAWETTTEEPTTERYTTTQGPPIISTTCGEVLNGRTGTILYKNYQTYDPNERCMWTIRIPDAQRITFNLLMSGVTQYPYDGIVVSTFKRGANGGTPLVGNQHLRGNTTGPVTLTGSVAIVMFYSDQSTQSTGFILTFEGEGIAQENSLSSRDDILKTDPGYDPWLKHPRTGGYANNELSTFLIAPQGYSYNTYFVDYTKRGLQSGCYDAIHAFQFQYATGWVQEVRYCSETSSNYRQFSDVPLYIFSSDASETSSGFYLDFVSYNEEISTTDSDY